MNEVDPRDPAQLPADLAQSAALIDDRREARHLKDEAFSAFYRNEIKPLIRYLMRQGADTALAAETAQESMLRAYTAWQGLTYPKAWVYKVARHELLTLMRRRREDPFEQVPEPTALLPRTDALIAVELRYDALQAIRRLPQRQREVIALSLSGFAPASIADILDITANTASASLKKARRALLAAPEFRQETS
ncbi:sigma-70 family RNA polymerase sigma factor [Streptomyces sp. NPDC048279]|uniref:RNA polymerase sigma factor n=1 Tax=unclassified Streptomyces TaxID=2593676 RepID=UPI00342D4E9C